MVVAFPFLALGEERASIRHQRVFVASYIPIFTDGSYIIGTRAHTQVCKSPSPSFLPRKHRFRGCCNSISGFEGERANGV